MGGIARPPCQSGKCGKHFFPDSSLWCCQDKLRHVAPGHYFGKQWIPCRDRLRSGDRAWLSLGGSDSPSFRYSYGANPNADSCTNAHGNPRSDTDTHASSDTNGYSQTHTDASSMAMVEILWFRVVVFPVKFLGFFRINGA